MATFSNIEQIKKKAVPILRRHKVTRAGIFGSWARGDASEVSDIDFLIDFDGSLLAKAALKLELEKQLNLQVDLINYRSIYHRIRENVLAEEIELF
jgi:uncharacterized protein